MTLHGGTESRLLIYGLALSVLGHGLVFAVGAIPGLLLRQLFKKPPIEIELLPPPKKPSPPPAPAPPPEPPMAPPAPVSSAGPGPSPSKQPGPKRVPPKPAKPQPPALANLTGLGPQQIDEDVGVRVVLAMPALRSSPHRATVEKVLAAFPDAHILAAGTRVPGAAALAKRLVDDLDGLLIATGRPRDLSATVFFALPRSGSGIADALVKTGAMADLAAASDERRLRTHPFGLLSFGLAELVGRRPPPTESTADGGTAAPGAPPAEPLPPTEEFLKSVVAQLRLKSPALRADVHNLKGRLKLRGNFPTPRALRLAVTADAAPLVHARIELSTPAEAAELAAALPGLKQWLTSRLVWLGLGDLLSGLTITLQKESIEIIGTLPQADTAVLLTWVEQTLPPPPRWVAPPAPPTAPPNVASDAKSPPDLAPGDGGP